MKEYRILPRVDGAWRVESVTSDYVKASVVQLNTPEDRDIAIVKVTGPASGVVVGLSCAESRDNYNRERAFARGQKLALYPKSLPRDPEFEAFKAGIVAIALRGVE